MLLLLGLPYTAMVAEEASFARAWAAGIRNIPDGCRIRESEVPPRDVP